jgi:hypothetical protein
MSQSDTAAGLRLPDRDHEPGSALIMTCEPQPPTQRAPEPHPPPDTPRPGRMMPALARMVIEAYTQPGQLALDPMCGIGTTLVEAVHADRDAVGVEYEPRWGQPGPRPERPTFRLPAGVTLKPEPRVREMTGTVRPAGLEPAAKCLEGTCSVH